MIVHDDFKGKERVGAGARTDTKTFLSGEGGQVLCRAGGGNKSVRNCGTTRTAAGDRTKMCQRRKREGPSGRKKSTAMWVRDRR